MIFWDKVCRKPLMMIEWDENPDLAEDEVKMVKWCKTYYLYQEDFDNDPSWVD